MTSAFSDPGLEVAIRRWLENRGWLSLLDIAPDLLADIERIVHAGTSLGRACLAGVSAVLWRLCGSPQSSDQIGAYNALSRWLRKIAARLCDDGASANDATQRALEAIHRNLKSVRDVAAFLGFCKTIAQREAIRRCLRPLSRVDDEISFTDLQPADPNQPDVEETFVDVAEPVEDAILDKLTGLRIWKCLVGCKSISLRQLKALILLHFRQMTPLEVAKSLHMKPGTLDVDLSRARAKLRADHMFAVCLEQAGASWGS